MNKIHPLLLVLILITSCTGREKTRPHGISRPEGHPSMQISEHVRRVFQDKAGNLWFGTNNEGVCRYDPNGTSGKSLNYFLYGYAVRGITEDDSGNIWFATSGGVTRYNGETFDDFTELDGLSDNGVWSILKDNTGTLWFGTEGGVSRYNPHGTAGQLFTAFPLPEADHRQFPDTFLNPKLVNCMMQDRSGKIWFGSNGGGAYRYDPATEALTNLSEKEGLCNNFVQCILEDKNGDFWFGTRFGGASLYHPDGEAGKSFTQFPFHYPVDDRLKDNFVWTIYEDKKGDLWFSATAGGLYRYSADETGAMAFTWFAENEGLTTRFIQSIFEDKSGTLWIGASGGLFRYDPKGKGDKSFINVKRNGPWP